MNRYNQLKVVSSVFLCGALLVGCGGSDNKKTTHSSSSSSNTSSKASFSSSSSSLSSANPVISLSVAVDAEVKTLMEQSGPTAVTIAFAKNGVITYEKAYGFQDAAKTIPLKTDALMRTASIIKPVTAAAIRQLASDGALSLSDHAFCTGSNAPCWLDSNLLSDSVDPRVKDITIQHLIEHKGGWYRDVSDDPQDYEVDIRDALKLSHPANREDIVTAIMTRPLDFSPGIPDFKHDNYSNFGYMLLSLIIEKAAKTSYTSYIQNTIMAQLGISSSDFKAGQTKLIDHDSREPFYIYSGKQCLSVFTHKMAVCGEEGEDVSNWLAVGYSITTARAMALFAQVYMLPNSSAVYLTYGINGFRLPEGFLPDGVHSGGQEGTTTLLRQLPSGVSYALFFNKKGVAVSHDKFDKISQLEP